MKTHTFTRQELFDLVWSEPMMRVAARYGISGNGLANLVDFLSRRRPDNTNVDVSHFYPGFKAPDRQHIQKALNDLDGYAFHMDKDRPTETELKVQKGDCIEIAAWLEKCLAAFLQGPAG